MRGTGQIASLALALCIATSAESTRGDQSSAATVPGSPIFRHTPTDPAAPVTNSVILLEQVTLAVLGWGAVEATDSFTPNFSLNQQQVVNTPFILTWQTVVNTDRNSTATSPGASNNLDGALALDLTTAHTVAVACGEFHTLLLKRDGSVVGRGWNVVGQTLVPAGLTNAIAIACGSDHSLAVRRDGSVIAWGYDRFGQSTVPAGLPPMQAVAGGVRHSLALGADGRVWAWGSNLEGQCEVPANLDRVASLAAGAYHSVAARTDGSVIAWGDNSAGQCDVPATLTDVVAVAAGGNFTLGLRANGTVVGWGANDFGQVTIPDTLRDVVAIAAGGYHGLALRRDGSVVAWGDNRFQSVTVPGDLREVAAIAAGGFHNEVLVRTLPPLTNPRHQRGKFSADLNLPAGWRYRLEATSDLQTWETLQTGTATPGEMTVSAPDTVGTGSRFFRAVPLSREIVRSRVERPY